MKQIKLIDFISSNLIKDFDSVLTVEIEDNVMAIGGFGEIYKCISVNGIGLQQKQVIKIFKDKFRGSEKHNFDTTRRLQKKLISLNRDLLTKVNRTVTEEYPAFQAIPQFTFTGILNGEAVDGFSANNLSEMGFIDFEEVITEGSNYYEEYCLIPIDKKLLMAHQLVSAFKILENFKFIHADIKASALFVNLKSYQCAVIDFDSGVITETVEDEPNTWGTPCEFVAPEIFDQLMAKSGSKIAVDIFTDRWSVAIAIHYLLTSLYALFYVSVISRTSTTQYFNESKWPFVDVNASYFNTANLETYNEYINFVNSAIPQAIVEKLSQTINYGYQNPAARTTYSEWKTTIESLIPPPELLFFDSDKIAVLNSYSATLSWATVDATSVEIDNGIGQVPVCGRMEVFPKIDTVYSIKVFGALKIVGDSVTIKTFPMPVIESIKVPIPDFQSVLKFNMPIFSSPAVLAPMKIERSKRIKIPELFEQLKNSMFHNDSPHKLSNEIWSITKTFNMIKSKLNSTNNPLC